ncbi:MAG: response regulator [Chloroflexi bacterium]|nr:response regulator [Chloroflexota bacterium]
MPPPLYERKAIMVRTIAVVDDDAAYLRFIEKALAGAGYVSCPITSFDAEEVVRVIAASGCEAAIIDVFMYNEPSGLSFVDAIREDPALAGLPLIVATGAREKAARFRLALRHQRCRVMLKPFGVDELLQALNETLSPRPVPLRRPQPTVLGPAANALLNRGIVPGTPAEST